MLRADAAATAAAASPPLYSGQRTTRTLRCRNAGALAVSSARLTRLLLRTEETGEAPAAAARPLDLFDDTECAAAALGDRATLAQAALDAQLPLRPGAALELPIEILAFNSAALGGGGGGERRIRVELDLEYGGGGGGGGGGWARRLEMSVELRVRRALAVGVLRVLPDPSNLYLLPAAGGRAAAAARSAAGGGPARDRRPRAV